MTHETKLMDEVNKAGSPFRGHAEKEETRRISEEPQTELMWTKVGSDTKE